ncbi:MAG: hypothetical protein KBD76_02925 [Bacteriovorax sp.]|jgi:capsular polysaccharide biosynthesis protein|nr:hypothetical protein [Bacteriovorax sp.]
MQEKIYIKDFILLLNRYKKSIFIIMTFTLLCSIELSVILPKSYKSEFELNIYPKYFYNSLISDIVPGINSSPEMTQTVAAMVKEVMNDQFIDEIGLAFKIYPLKMNEYQQAKERSMLRDHFELYSAGGNTFHVSFNHKNPHTAFEVSKKVLETVRNYFINTRISTIELAQQTILKKLESVNITKQISDTESNGSPFTTKNPTVLLEELSKIKQDIASLKLQFNSNHPSIIRLLQKQSNIEEYLKEIGGAGQKSFIDDNQEQEKGFSPVLMSNDKETSKSITSKLYSNFNNINIALDIERESVSSYIGITEAPQFPTSPLFPKKRLFASLGLVLGLIFCFLYILYKEVMHSAPLEDAQQMAEKFNGSFFGTLPEINEADLMSNQLLSLAVKEKSTKNIAYNPVTD